MKANRKFVKADEHAVSAVIGVILMVAITVAIAATVYYYVTTMMPKSGSTSPTFSLRVDDQVDRLIVTSADPAADWNRLGMTTNKGANLVYFALNAQVDDGPTDGAMSGEVGEVGTAVATSGTTPTEICIATDLMSATEYLDFEYDGTGIGGTDVQITLIDTSSNQEIGTYSITTIREVDGPTS
jgi:hypothetical protein